MQINKKQIEEINNIQLEIFKNFIDVCDKLNLKYYMVHGSLLGSVRYKGFFPFDDDIDVAMPREDYEIFIKNGQKLLKANYFIQCNKTEKDYPLVFAKIRDSNTTFIQRVLKNININKGIYIDIFPIDNYPTSIPSLLKIKFLEKIYRTRVLAQLNKKRNIIKNIICKISKIILPNYEIAIKKLNNLYINVPKTNMCIVYGGKTLERKIGLDLFGEGKNLKFEGLNIIVPNKYKEYLNIIYGDYTSYSPCKQYMVNKELIEISANIIDTKNSYKLYENKNKKDKENEK